MVAINTDCAILVWFSSCSAAPCVGQIKLHLFPLTKILNGLIILYNIKIYNALAFMFREVPPFITDNEKKHTSSRNSSLDLYVRLPDILSARQRTLNWHNKSPVVCYTINLSIIES